ncbi:hypothetical protein HETIRDRAFT_419686 [Heterobasidion irregulare TC 32-1]|uniref:Protein kinase domain-containing protein n=1 Tax=Heterobasidion irregulare (strain TC 32-1) TaxID=747525 RepID=W4K4V9_HETIT|nr:uncharacterized protein HETIRDRAFT_419686 [Heterobasidion irregulare TC 32-1]ETW80096.1 hypothetical protein HETIRDRAFT_419686 [Heterobasidion irregulare TC 32-1]
MTPHQQGAGSFQNFTTQQNVSSIREAIKTELENKVTYNDARVFTAIHKDLADNHHIERCYLNFQEANSVQSAIHCLQTLEAQTKTAPNIDIESHLKRDEKAMYPHLAVIFDFIRNFFADIPAPTKLQKPREFRVSTGPLTDGGHTLGFPKINPDFVVIGSEVGNRKGLWRDISAFVEIKPTKAQGPRTEKTKDTTIKPIVTQAADYARLFVSARPFMLFSVGLLIFGSGFCVAIFDRDGITFSPQLDMWEDTKDFIRVIHALSCQLTDAELGQDPTVYELDRSTAKRLIGAQDSSFYPSYIIKPIAEDTQQRFWCTIGSPLWSSLSLLGRGSIVWKVREYDTMSEQFTGFAMILKTMWRSSTRDSEASIYETVVGIHPGVARYLIGGDVRDPRPDLRRPRATHDRNLLQQDIITVRHLRGEIFDAFVPTPVLHRLIVSTLGRPLWEYSSDLELMKGMRAALEGHQFLYKQGILHRDISAGNILLAADPTSVPAGHEGFITDLEFAWLETVFKPTTETEPASLVIGGGEIFANTLITSAERKRTTFHEQAKRGGTITGTLQFMAIELLSAMGKGKGHEIKHAHHHDIESFIWVIAYSVLRKLVFNNIATQAEMTALKSYFRRSFGGLTANAIMDNRTNALPFAFTSDSLLATRFVPRTMSGHLSFFIAELRAYVLRHLPIPTPPKEYRHSSMKLIVMDPATPPYTYEWLRSAFTDVIDGLSAQEYMQ